MLHTKFPRLEIGPTVVEKKFFEGVLPNMGMADILVM